MRTHRKVIKEEDVVDTVTCNRCGGKCTEAHLAVDYRGGYDSNPLIDGVEYSFDLCEPCMKNLILSFVVPPTVYDWHDGCDIDHTVNMFHP